MKTVTLTTIASKIKMDPKNARAKLRRAKVPTSLLADKDSWTFKASAVGAVTKLLRSDNRKNAA